MIYAFVAAFAWGIADYAAAVVSRRIGSTRTVIAGQLAGWAAVVLTLIVTGSPVPPVNAVLLLLVSGVAAAGGYLTFYRGLELGPVAIVSPVTAAYGAVAATFAIVVFHESTTVATVLAIVFTAGGTALASSSTVAHDAGEDSGGLRYALAAVMMFGIAAFALGAAARDTPSLTAVAIGRTASVLVLSPIILRGGRRVETHRDQYVIWAAAVGVLDVAAIAAYAKAAAVGPVSLAAAISATYPVVPIIGAVLLLRERLGRRQWAGVACVFAGLLMLGLR